MVRFVLFSCFLFGKVCVEVVGRCGILRCVTGYFVFPCMYLRPSWYHITGSVKFSLLQLPTLLLGLSSVTHKTSSGCGMTGACRVMSGLGKIPYGCTNSPPGFAIGIGGRGLGK